MSLNEAPILVACNDAQLANELVARVTRANGDVVYAANKLQAVERLEHFTFAAAVLVQQRDADDIGQRLREEDIPYCLLDKASSKPVYVSAGDTVAVYDIDLVIPTLRALLARSGKKMPNS
jgi:hypothetical protein